MSSTPFRIDPAIPARLAQVTATARAQLRHAARQFLASRPSPRHNLGNVLLAAEAHDLVARFRLASIRDLMCLLLETAQDLSDAAISNFQVGAVGLEAGTGHLILGGNLEFPGTHLGYTVHGEGFVFTRAMSRGTDVEVIAIGEAHPCAHCRQYLSEYASSSALELIDPLGHTLTLAQLYPWPFDPAYLGEQGAVPSRILWPDLTFTEAQNSTAAEALLGRGRRSHTPYSKCPAALTLHLRDGKSVTGLAVESVAFNPTIHPLQSAVIDLVAHGYGYADITGATLGTVRGGAVDYSASTQEVLRRVAPDAPVLVLGWMP